MGKTVLGSFAEKHDAITAINVNELAGLQSRNITIFTNEENAKELEDEVTVTIKTNTLYASEENNEEHSESFLEKIMEKFSSSDDFELTSEQELVDFGLSEVQAKQCMFDVENGKIVVLADDELRMGHQDDVENTSFH